MHCLHKNANSTSFLCITIEVYTKSLNLTIYIMNGFFVHLPFLWKSFNNARKANYGIDNDFPEHRIYRTYVISAIT